MPRSNTLAAVAAALLLAACASDEPTSPDTALPSASRAAPSDPTPNTIALSPIAVVNGGGPGAAEITAFDPVSKRLFIVNGAAGTVDVVDLRRPEAPRPIGTLSFSGAANSVDAEGGVVAIAVQAADKVSPGTVEFYRATTLAPISSVQVGALPDMLTFTPSGRQVVVANEGEPNNYLAGNIDPEGSVSIIDVSNVNRPTVRTATFTRFNGQQDALRAQGIRIFGPGASVAQDLEPEYIAVSDDETTAWVTLQENNALAVVDLPSATVTALAPLGFKNHALAGNALDPSDSEVSTSPRRGRIAIRPWPVLGMYQPDAIAAFTVGGQTYLITANEGDARDYPGFNEEARVRTLGLEPGIFTTTACYGAPCTRDSLLGRLTVTSTLGRNAGTGLYDALYAFGARSFSVWSTQGTLLWDSGDQLEQLTTALPNVAFNASNDNNTLDDRSDNKGPEPEGVVIGTLGERTFAFVGLERVGGVAVYDVSSPTSPSFVTYANTRTGATGDRGPEGLEFVPAVRSPSKTPLLIVGHETSGTTTIFEIELR